jgi:hypothetical protein
MTLLDWRQHHLWIRRNRQFLPSQRVSEVISAEIVALPERRFPRAAAQTRIISVARIRLDLPKSVRPFKRIFCTDVSEFESHMPSQAVPSLWCLCETLVVPDMAPTALMRGPLRGGPRPPSWDRDGARPNGAGPYSRSGFTKAKLAVPSLYPATSVTFGCHHSASAALRAYYPELDWTASACLSDRFWCPLLRQKDPAGRRVGRAHCPCQSSGFTAQFRTHRPS